MAQLAHEKGYDKEYALYEKVEHMAPEIIAEKRKMYKGVNANVDFYSGLVYHMLGIPEQLYTPILPQRESLDGATSSGRADQCG